MLVEKPEILSIQEKDGYKYYIFKTPSETEVTNNNASHWSFMDEEDVRIKYYYPYLKPKMHVLDIGAGFGSYTLPALARGCKVTVITPQVPPPNNEHIKLKMNLELNKFECNIIDMAVHGDDGWVNPNTKDFVTKYPHRLKVKEKRDYVRCKKLDDIIVSAEDTKTKVDYLKMDVEGAEYEALKGAEQLIKRDKPILLIENHLFYDGQMERKILHLILGWDINYMAKVTPYHAISHSLFLQK